MKLRDYLQEAENRYYITPAMVAAMGVFIISIFALFVPPYIGMADNGDYFRILYSNGLFFNDPNYDSQYLGYFVKNYGILQYFNENGSTIFSSQSIFIKLSIIINQLLYSTEIFDIRFQAAIYLVLYVTGIYLLVEALTWKLRNIRSYIISVLTIFIFADSAYTAYFNSFFSESVVLISLIYMVASLLLIRAGKYNVYVLLIVFTVASLLLTTSKQQNAPVGVIIACMGILLVFVKRNSIYRIITAISLVSILVAGIGSYVVISDEFKNINKFHAMNRGVILNSSDPEAALETFGIDRQYAVLSGDIYYLPYSTVDVNSNMLEENFYNKYGYFSILAYYIMHPTKAAEMLDLAAKNGFATRPAAMGNYEMSAGKEFGSQTSYFSLYSDIKQAAAPKTFGFIVIWASVIIGYFAPTFIAAFRKRDKEAMITFPLMLTLIAIGISAMLVSIIGAGDADLAKHQFLFTSCFDVITYLFISSWLGHKL
ncbi:MAG TPA: hypothetical protein IAA29_17780 [Candidatus Paenibacillus intestinavium]|nr:hypothetical protein [Candidatus Paenibacillus intestinavium]